MKFGTKLRDSIYPPWKHHYIDYALLKKLLREDRPDDESTPWTEKDENRFCDEIFNNQLEKVVRFQEETFAQVRDQIDETFQRLQDLADTNDGATGDDRGSSNHVNHDENMDNDRQSKGKGEMQDKRGSVQLPEDRLRRFEEELDQLTNQIRELKRYSNLNYTGFLKIVKKHDRKRGDAYKVRPMMQLSLAKRPFNSEKGYSPLLNKLSIMYYIIRQQRDQSGNGDADAPLPPLDLDVDVQEETVTGDVNIAHKFWVHPDNLLEVKTHILRHLPSLVFSTRTEAGPSGNDEPTITSIYFDSAKFDLYAKKVERDSEASSVRLRWHNQLLDMPEILLEQKTVYANGRAEDHRMAIKEKYVQRFLCGEYSMEKTVAKMERAGKSPDEVEAFRASAHQLQEFILSKRLSPVVRATYVRTAFQAPQDDRVRISLDSDVVFVREDALDRDRPYRNPQDWHRTDIDNHRMTYPFADLRQNEVACFPYVILEVKVQEGLKRPAWVEDLMVSHLLHPAPRFSKFVHGVASLFEDYVNALPFWLSELDTDIRRDPQQAFQEEAQRRIQKVEGEQLVGSLLGENRLGNSMSYRASVGSPAATPVLETSKTPDDNVLLSQSFADRSAGDASLARQQQQQQQQQQQHTKSQSRKKGSAVDTLTSILPRFSMSRYAQNKRARENQISLPEGVVEPRTWLKNDGELKIEPKVWLANERTFLKWQHIGILLGSLAVALYTAASGRGVAAAVAMDEQGAPVRVWQRGVGNHVVAEVMGLVYVGVAAFAGAWGYRVHRQRQQMIHERSGRDFDNVVGPVVVSVAIMMALVLNTFLQFRAVLQWDDAVSDEL